MMIPRDYQIAAIQSVPIFYQSCTGEKDRNVLICMPTGTGKSIVIAELVKYIMKYPGQRVLMATHVKELIQQNFNKLLECWPTAPAGIYSAGLKRKDTHAPILFCGIQSVAKNAHVFGKVDILFIDEAHLVSPKDSTAYRKFITALKVTNPWLKVIGLTATPWRMGHGKITEGPDRLFTDVCFDITDRNSFNRLISEGYLCMLVPQKTRFDLDKATEKVGTQGGEFKQGELQVAVDKTDITRRALEEVIELVQGTRHHWLLFAAGVEHAIHCAEMLNSMGISAIAIHSDLSSEERDEAIAGWKSGKYTCATNNNVLTTGIDFPGIDLIIMLRPSKSAVLWVQMLGRGTRPVYADGFDLTTIEGRIQAIANGPKQDCLVLDFANNTKSLGPINDPKIPRKPGEGGGEAPAKLCDACKAWNHPTAKVCFRCGEAFTFHVKIQDKADDRDLIKGDTPITEVFDVRQITYTKHPGRNGKPPSLKLTYYTAFKSFMEFVPLEGYGSLKGLAKRWWLERSRTIPMPDSVDEALAVVNQLPAATHIRVWINQQYPKILAACFDGTKFGTQSADMRPVLVAKAPTPAPSNTVPWKKEETESLEEASVRQLQESLAKQRQQGYLHRDDDVGF